MQVGYRDDRSLPAPPASSFISSLWMSPCFLSIIQRSPALSSLRTLLCVVPSAWKYLSTLFTSSYAVVLTFHPTYAEPFSVCSIQTALSQLNYSLSSLFEYFLHIFDHKGLICYIFISSSVIMMCTTSLLVLESKFH